MEMRGAECYMRSRDGQWLLRNFAYHDVLGSVTSTEGPLLKGAYWIDDDATETVVDSYVGIGSGVLALLSEICYLDSKTFQMDASIVSEEFDDDIEVDGDPDFWQKADELEFRLQHWIFPECSDPILVELVEAYRSSAFIALYRKQRSFLTSQPALGHGRSLSLINCKITQAIEETLVHIQQVPIQSLPECGLLFPLFMVGGETLEAKNIELVRLRVQTLLKDRGFGNIGKAQEVLEELWRLRVTGAKGPKGRELDWMDILKRKGWRLMLS
jgi:transcriptional activator protein UGA3